MQSRRQLKLEILGKLDEVQKQIEILHDHKQFADDKTRIEYGENLERLIENLRAQAEGMQNLLTLSPFTNNKNS